MRPCPVPVAGLAGTANRQVESVQRLPRLRRGHHDVPPAWTPPDPPEAPGYETRVQVAADLRETDLEHRRRIAERRRRVRWDARANAARAEKAEGRPWAPKGAKREPAHDKQSLVSRDTAPSNPAAEPERERDVIAKERLVDRDEAAKKVAGQSGAGADEKGRDFSILTAGTRQKQRERSGAGADDRPMLHRGPVLGDTEEAP